MTDDLNEKLDYVRDRVVADAKAKPTPEAITELHVAAIRHRSGSIGEGVTLGDTVDARKIIKALTDAGYVIVPKADMQCIVDNLVLALARNDEARKNLDKARAMTTDAGS